MKQLQIIVRPSIIDDVMTSLRSVDVGGLTLSDIQGEGKAEPPLVGDTYSMKQVLVVVPDKKVSEIFENLSKLPCTKPMGSGKVFVTEIPDALDLCSGKSGVDAI